MKGHDTMRLHTLLSQARMRARNGMLSNRHVALSWVHDYAAEYASPEMAAWLNAQAEQILSNYPDTAEGVADLITELKKRLNEWP